MVIEATEDSVAIMLINQTKGISDRNVLGDFVTPPSNEPHTAPDDLYG